MIIDILTEKNQFRSRYKIIHQCITFILVSLVWVPFRAEKIADTIVIY